jgi:hypothetical protein
VNPHQQAEDYHDAVTAAMSQPGVDPARVHNYAEIARLGRVTRARMSQIMRLLHLAQDIQEQLLFLPEIRGLNERNLRAIVSRMDWSEQRRMFQEIGTNA